MIHISVLLVSDQLLIILMSYQLILFPRIYLLMSKVRKHYTCGVMLISFMIGITINVIESLLESLPDTDTLCSSSDPYHNVTLNCTSSKPATVLSDFILTWTHNNTPIRSGLVTTSTSKTMDSVNYTTNILRLFNTYNNDSGVYTCRATLNFPDQPITLSKSYILKGKKGHYLYN